MQAEWPRPLRCSTPLNDYCRTLHDVDSQLSNINQLTAFLRLSRRKHIASVLEDIALLLDDALAGILVRLTLRRPRPFLHERCCTSLNPHHHPQYGSEFKALEGDHERVNLDNSGQVSP
jgi:hypothetical protein